MSDRRKSLVTNSAANGATMLLGLLLSCILAPIMLARLGTEGFGLWAITGSFAVYGSLLDLGVTRAMPYFVARFEGDADHHKTEQVAGLALAMILAGGLVLLIASWLGAPALQARVKEYTVEEVRVLMIAVATMVTFNAVAQVFAGVFAGLREAVLANAIFVCGAVLNFAASMMVLIFRPGLVPYAWANAAAIALQAVMMLVAVARRWGRLPIAMPDRGLARLVVGTSMKTQATWAGDTLNLQAGKVAVALFLGLGPVAAYEVALRVIIATRQVAVLSISALVPEAASRIASDGPAAIPVMYRDYTRKVTPFVAPVFALACISGPALMKGWLGAVPSGAAVVLLGLGVGHLVDVLTGVGYSLALADGNPGLAARTTCGGAMLSLVGIAAATPFLGVTGAVIGTSLGMAAASTVFLTLFHRRYSLPMAELWKNSVPAIGLVAICATVPTLASMVVSIPASRLGALAYATGLALAFVLPYLVIAYRRQLLPQSFRFTGGFQPA